MTEGADGQTVTDSGRVLTRMCAASLQHTQMPSRNWEVLIVCTEEARLLGLGDTGNARLVVRASARMQVAS